MIYYPESENLLPRDIANIHEILKFANQSAEKLINFLKLKLTMLPRLNKHYLGSFLYKVILSIRIIT